MSVVVLAAATAAVLCWPRRRSPRERVTRLTAVNREQQPVTTQLRRPVVIAAGLAVAAVVAAGGSWWLVAALVTAGLVGARARPRDLLLPQDIALAADLMAACLSGGAGIADALCAATGSTGGQLRARADPVVAELRQGSTPELAWSTWLADEQLAPIARTCVRSGGSGAAVAAELSRVAARIRTRQRAVGQERVARASVWVVLPLGLCFLPAFVLVGVVPLVLGLLHTLH